MAKVYLACVAKDEDSPFVTADFFRLTHYAGLDSVGQHCVVDDPAQADLVAFIGSGKVNFTDITHSVLYRHNRHKAVIFHNGDRLIPWLPGLYVCLHSNWLYRRKKTIAAGFYLRVTDNVGLEITDDIQDAKYVFSFLGNANNHAVRKKICQLPKTRAYLEDTSSNAAPQEAKAIEAYQRKYQQLMIQTKFVLCPCGLGVSSWRLFETMRAGRVPVIVADHWTRPKGPDWEAFALFVKENAVHEIPALLFAQEHTAKHRGRLARKNWETFYAEGVVFNTAVDGLLACQKNKGKENRLLALLMLIVYLHPHYFRHWLLSPIKQYCLNAIKRYGQRLKRKFLEK